MPVSIIGTFAVMYVFGFSINALTLFGLVLAIGIVVDDAIVVVENVERNIEEGLSPREASYKAMTEVSGPIIAIALVLIAVFVPLAFITGLSGQFYKQFALTIAISTVISAINSLTLSPALSALLLKERNAPPDRLTRIMNALFGWLFRGFNWVFSRGVSGYGVGVRSILTRKSAVMLVYAAMLGPPSSCSARSRVASCRRRTSNTWWVSRNCLTGHARPYRRRHPPHERDHDARAGRGECGGLPRTVDRRLQNSSNAGIVFSTLKPFEERKSPRLSAGAIAMSLNQKYGVIQDAFIAMFPPPPVQGLGVVGGFKLQIEDRAGRGYEALNDVTKAFMARAMVAPELIGQFTTYQVNVPQIFADVDRTKARQLGVPITSVFETLQIYLGSLYVNDFNKFGRTYSVRVQATRRSAPVPRTLASSKVRSNSGEMVPLAALLRVKTSAGPERAMRYNGFLTADINAAPAPGYSWAKRRTLPSASPPETLPPGFDYEWTDLTYQEILAGNSAIWVFPSPFCSYSWCWPRNMKAWCCRCRSS